MPCSASVKYILLDKTFWFILVSLTLKAMSLAIISKLIVDLILIVVFFSRNCAAVCRSKTNKYCQNNNRAAEERRGWCNSETFQILTKKSTCDMRVSRHVKYSWQSKSQNEELMEWWSSQTLLSKLKCNKSRSKQVTSLEVN